MSKRKREIELDLLRVLALLAVMVMHSTVGASRVPDSAAGKAMVHAVWAGATWCVPCFVMISGRFFLDPERDVSIRSIWTKSIPRIVLSFAVWTVVYLQFFRTVGGWNVGLLDIPDLVIGPYHLWYLYLIAGLYLITPLLRKIAEDERLTRYFLAAFFVVTVFREYLVYLPDETHTLSRVMEYAHIHMVVSYSGYFLLGWALYRAKLSPAAELGLYAAGLVCFFFTCFAAVFLPIPEGENEYFYQLYMKPNVIVESAALYCFFLKRVSRHNFSAFSARLIGLLARLNFGMYLSHVLFVEWLAPRCPGMSVFLWVPTQVLFAFCGSAVLTWLLQRIPILRRVC